MPQIFTCPHCRRTSTIADEFAGQSGPCAGCGRIITVPLNPGSVPMPPNLDESAAIRMLLPVGRSIWAIAAGYLGLFSVLMFPAPFAILISVLAIRDIRKNPKKHGLGRAIFGLVMGIIFTIPLLVFLYVLCFVEPHRRFH